MDFDDATLMSALTLDDASALEAIYERYGGLVFAVASRIVRNNADAEDVTSEVFWELWARRERYDATRSCARSYILLLARSRAIDRLRERPTSQSLPVDVAESDLRDSRRLEPHRADGAVGVDAEAHELRRKVQSAMASLEAPQQVALGLAFYGGLSHRQIADRLAAPLGTVKTNIRKGLLKLKHVLRSNE